MATEAAAPRKTTLLALGHMVKTRMCEHFQSGKCFFGEKCNFAHSSAELQRPVDLSKTSLCKDFMTGVCPHHSRDCPFAHGRGELRRVLPRAAPSRNSLSDLQGEALTSSSRQPLQSPKPCGQEQRRQRQEPLREVTSAVVTKPFQKTQPQSQPRQQMMPQPQETPSVSVSTDEDEYEDEDGDEEDDEQSFDFNLKSKTASPSCVSTCASLPELHLPTSGVGVGGGTQLPLSPRLCLAEMEAPLPSLPKVGTVQMPAFVWQNQLFLGRVEDVLRQAEPDYYED